MEVLWIIVTVLGVFLFLALCIVLYYYCLWRSRRLRASILPLYNDTSHSSNNTCGRDDSLHSTSTLLDSTSTRGPRASSTSSRNPTLTSTSTHTPRASSTSSRDPSLASISKRTPRASSTSSRNPKLTSTSTHTPRASSTSSRDPSLASISKRTPQASTTATRDPSLSFTTRIKKYSSISPAPQCASITTPSKTNTFSSSRSSVNQSFRIPKEPQSSILPSATQESRKPYSSTRPSTSQAPKVLSQSFYPSVQKRKEYRPSEWQPTVKRATTSNSSFLPPTPPASPPIPIVPTHQHHLDSSPTNSISEQFLLSPNGSPTLHYQHGDLRQTDILCRELGDPRLDLHGQTVTEAINTTEKFLDQSQGKYDTVRIVTGRGVHAEGGVPKIKPAIEKLLKKQKYRLEEENQGGCFVVSIAPHESASKEPSPTNSISRQFTLSSTGSPTLHFHFVHKLQSEILSREEGVPALDLRGLTVMEAKLLTIKFLSQSKGKFDTVRIVTGRGLHNGGVSKIRPVIERVLNDLSYKFTEDKVSLGGCLVVDLD